MILNEEIFEIDIPNVVHDDIEISNLETEIPQPGPEIGVSNLITQLINSTYSMIEDYNSLSIALSDNQEAEKAQIVSSMISNEHVHIGMLQSLLECFSPNADSIETGEEIIDNAINESFPMNNGVDLEKVCRQIWKDLDGDVSDKEDWDNWLEVYWDDIRKLTNGESYTKMTVEGDSSKARLNLKTEGRHIVYKFFDEDEYYTAYDVQEIEDAIKRRNLNESFKENLTEAKDDNFSAAKAAFKEAAEDGINPLYEGVDDDFISSLCYEVEESLGLEGEPSVQFGDGIMTFYSGDEETNLDYQTYSEDVVDMVLNSTSSTQFKSKYKNYLNTNIFKKSKEAQETPKIDDLDLLLRKARGLISIANPLWLIDEDEESIEQYFNASKKDSIKALGKNFTVDNFSRVVPDVTWPHTLLSQMTVGDFRNIVGDTWKFRFKEEEEPDIHGDLIYDVVKPVKDEYNILYGINLSIPEFIDWATKKYPNIKPEYFITDEQNESLTEAKIRPNIVNVQGIYDYVVENGFEKEAKEILDDCKIKVVKGKCIEISANANPGNAYYRLSHLVDSKNESLNESISDKFIDDKIWEIFNACVEHNSEADYDVNKAIEYYFIQQNLPSSDDLETDIGSLTRYDKLNLLDRIMGVAEQYHLLESLNESMTQEQFDERVETVMKPFAADLDAFEDENGDDFYVTWSFGVNDDDKITAGLDIHFDRRFMDEETKDFDEETIKPFLDELESIIDKNGFELDNVNGYDYKVKGPKTSMFTKARHYQIIEK